MRSKKLYVFFALVLIFSMILASCGQKATPTEVPAAEVPATEAPVAEEPAAVEPTVEEPVAEEPAAAEEGAPKKYEKEGEFKSMSWNMGETDIPTVDPALSTDTSSNQINGLIFAGIMTQDETTAEFQPGMATDIAVSDDGLTYTYTLRTDVPWVHYNAESGEVEPVKDCDGNYRYVTAKDFEYGIKRTVNPATASDYAFMVTGYVVGAAEYFSGTGTADDVAVKALDDATLEITYLKDIAINTMIPGIWVTYATPSWLIEGDTCTEAMADRWIEAEYIQTYGPYAMKEWIHDDHMTIIRNPYWPDDIATIPSAKIDEISFPVYATSSAHAAYEAGELDGISSVLNTEIDRIKADPVLQKEFSIGENFCTYFYGFNTTAEYVDDARVRRALSMAVDRQSLVDNVTKGGQIPAQWFSRPGLVAAPKLSEYPDLGIKYDPEGAKAELQSYMDEKGIKDPNDITITLMFNTNESHQNIAVAVQQMWKDVLGINALVQNQEWAVYLKTIRGADTPQVWRLGWCQDYPDAANFVDDQASSGGSSNPTEDGLAGSKPTGGFMWYNQEFEDLVNKALTLKDTAERTKLYAQAEEILVHDDAVMIPLYWYTSCQLAKGKIDRTYSVMGGKESFNKWDILPEGETREPAIDFDALNASEAGVEALSGEAAAPAEAAPAEVTVENVEPKKYEKEGEFKSMSWNMGETDIPTVDPALSTDTSSNQINGLIFAGIMTQDETTAEFQPGMATDIAVSDDGLTYTYTLRTDVPWVHYNAESGEVEPVKDCDGNYRYVTAKDFEYGIKRTVNPATASDYAFMVTGYVVGAAEYFSGTGTADDVAVKALDDATLEITYLKDIAINTMIPGIWVTYATPSWLIEGDTCTEAMADRWIEAEYIQTYGPYAMKEWIHDDHMTIIRNPYWPDDIATIPSAKIDEISFPVYATSSAHAAYEAGELDGISSVLNTEIDRIKADPVLQKEFSIGENFCTYFYGFNTTAEYVDDARVRRALSMAVDRQSLVDNVTKGGQIPAQWFSRPGLVAAPKLSEYPDLGIKYDPEGAKAELQSYMDEKGIKDPNDITITLMFNTNESHQNIAVAVQQMWKDVLGINALVQNQEWAVYLKTIRGADTPQVWRLGWCQDYPDAANFVDDQASSGGSSNPTEDGLAGSKPTGGFMWYNQEFEDLVNKALTLKDTAERTKLYAQAEEILVHDDAVMIPLYWYTSCQLAKGKIDRTYSVMGGKESFNKWDILPEGETREPAIDFDALNASEAGVEALSGEKAAPAEAAVTEEAAKAEKKK